MNDFIKKTLKLMYLEFIIVILILTCCTLIILNRDFDLFAIIFLISEAYILTDLIRRMIKNKRVIKNISSNDKVMYENELKHIILNDGDNIYTENYVFFEHGLNICKYDEIIMVYIANTPQRAHMNKDWCMITKKGKIYTVKISEKHLLEKEIMHNENLELDKLLSSKNPNILVGKTKENIKILRKKYNIRGIL